MSQIQKGETFADGQIVTYDRLNDLVDSAVLLPPVINGQTALSPLTGNEETLIYDPASLSLKKCLLKNALLTGNNISTGLISNAIGGVTINGWTEVRLDAPNIKLENYATVGSSIDLNTHSSIQLSSSSGNINFTVPNGNITFTSTRSIRLPVGTTAQRPATPLAGEIRFNSTTLQTETYNGSSWSSGNYSLYEVYEETITPWGASYAGEHSNIWTSAQFTKPSDEIWKFEIEFEEDGNKGYGYSMSMFYVSSGAGTAVFVKNFVDSQAGNWNTSNSEYHSWTVNQGTALTNEQLRFRAYAGNGSQMRLFQTYANGITFPSSKFRIHKYKMS